MNPILFYSLMPALWFLWSVGVVNTFFIHWEKKTYTIAMDNLQITGLFIVATIGFVSSLISLFGRVMQFIQWIVG